MSYNVKRSAAFSLLSGFGTVYVSRSAGLSDAEGMWVGIATSMLSDKIQHYLLGSTSVEAVNVTLRYPHKEKYRPLNLTSTDAMREREMRERETYRQVEKSFSSGRRGIAAIVL